MRVFVLVIDMPDQDGAEDAFWSVRHDQMLISRMVGVFDSPEAVAAYAARFDPNKVFVPTVHVFDLNELDSGYEHLFRPAPPDGEGE